METVSWIRMSAEKNCCLSSASSPSFLRSVVSSFRSSVRASVRSSVPYVVSSFARTSVQRGGADGARWCRYWCPLLSLEAWQWSVVAAGATLALMLCVYVHDLWTSDNNSDDDSDDGGSKRTSQHKPLRADEEDSDEYGAAKRLF